MSEDQPDFANGVAVTAIADGGMLAGWFEGEKVLLVHQAGRFCALSAVCTHMKAPLGDGMIVGDELICPWHHARFRLESGEAIAAPAFKPLARFAVEERDGQLFVTGKRGAPTIAVKAVLDSPRIVILGGGAAGYACAEMLTRNGWGGAVTLVSAETDPPYDRTVCSKQYLTGQMERDDCLLEGAEGRSETRFRRQLGRTALSIDTGQRKLRLDDGTTIAFDILVLATGAEPNTLDKPGFDRPDVHFLRTLRDADALMEAASPGKRAVVIGAGFIGLEAAASLTQRKLSVDVIAPDAIPLAAVLGPEVGAMIRGVHEEKGVRFHLGREAISYDGKVVRLDDGSEVPADLVILGLGVVPRTKLAEEAGITCADKGDGGGVFVNSRLETSASGIFAAGDIARYPDARLRRPIRVEHWVHAERQGQHVARVVMGMADEYLELPFFWSAHFDTGLRYLGHAGPADARIDGSVAGRDFSVAYRDGEQDAAVATCNRDRKALEIDAAWNPVLGHEPTVAG